ncbi:MAG TPA: glycoside hydrolase family 32 protein [Flavobacteriaceae bacterium]|nr:glycoside hydrolase family 32 protein [Flavobacteriaceae bacterium]MCB9213933.1 glycoside hydrolase family 32 protein [Alteromonas sp.]HPF11082.1 glycoside hydrolase family 32 protein [Flavobacteriaceae bacterium]HQU21250.1 glycoside hydrolase family 32 protein [Flavobacteriaceae bacterium]HQU64309.1 glycoside hydrolase family 32 protein [Flavobacteriaceae bacterium]
MNRLIFAVSIVLMISCKDKHVDSSSGAEEPHSVSTYYQEPFRPQFHFSPPNKWMNDPNGLVFHHGIYHLFYQYYPEDIVWGPMHWGHAVSQDLIHWEHKPIALYPDEHGLIFSGSAVVDLQNTSGFGTIENPPLVAIFTYHNMDGEKQGRNDFQTQGIAFSLDDGDTWTKYGGNPVIQNKGLKDFRDPKVFWYAAQSKWILTLVAGDHAKFFESTNLKDWKLMSEFGKNQGAHGGVWECPDLFPLFVEGTDETKWVLLISMNPGAPNGGSGTQYFIGDFNGITFTSEQDQAKWLDYGMDDYAGVTYNNLPLKNRTFIGWMSNWNYARNTPTEAWRSSMTLPRNLSLITQNGDYFLRNYPVKTLEGLTSKIEIASEIVLRETFTLQRDDFMQTDFSFNADLSKPLKVVYGNTSGHISLEVRPDTGTLVFDRSQSGIVDFEESFGKHPQNQPYIPSGEEVEVRIILDRSSVEIFIDGGRYVFTNQVFPIQPYTTLSITGTGQTLAHVQLNAIKSIWNE